MRRFKNVTAKRMTRMHVLSVVVLAAFYSPAGAEPPASNAPEGDEGWTKQLADRSQRGTLHNAYQKVRGDSGKWNDDALALHAPPLKSKPANLALDDWIDMLLEGEVQTAAGDDNWLLVRSRQLNDNDRAWVQRIERRGEQITVHIHEAVWEGKYGKNFTYYEVFGVNVGKLPPGDYKAKVVIQPLLFAQFEGPGRPADNWSKDERPGNTKPVELPIAFTVAVPP